MKKIFIPTDRVGLDNYQKSISLTYRLMNEMLESNITVEWFTSPQRIVSEAWPEGHIHDSGFAIEDNENNKALLMQNEIIFEEIDELSAESFKPRKSKIAFYFGKGAGADFALPLEEVLQWGGFTVERVDDFDIRDGKLEEYDILVVPGSPDAGECYYHGLGELGFEKLREYIYNKGHYLGVCGGSYLPLTSYNKANHTWLNVVEATDTQDLDFWRTGSAHVRVRLDDAGHPIFSGLTAGDINSMNLVYWEGPAIEIRGSNIKSLGHFEKMLASGATLMPFWDMFNNEMAKEACSGYYNPVTDEEFDTLLKGTSAFAEGEYGQGHLIMFSPHPEMGNVGYAKREDSMNFLLLYNGLMYLSSL